MDIPLRLHVDTMRDTFALRHSSSSSELVRPGHHRQSRRSGVANKKGRRTRSSSLGTPKNRLRMPALDKKNERHQQKRDFIQALWGRKQQFGGPEEDGSLYSEMDEDQGEWLGDIPKSWENEGKPRFNPTKDRYAAEIEKINKYLEKVHVQRAQSPRYVSRDKRDAMDRERDFVRAVHHTEFQVPPSPQHMKFNEFKRRTRSREVEENRKGYRHSAAVSIQSAWRSGRAIRIADEIRLKRGLRPKQEVDHHHQDFATNSIPKDSLIFPELQNVIACLNKLDDILSHEVFIEEKKADEAALTVQKHFRGHQARNTASRERYKKEWVSLMNLKEQQKQAEEYDYNQYAPIAEYQGGEEEQPGSPNQQEEYYDQSQQGRGAFDELFALQDAKNAQYSKGIVPGVAPQPVFDFYQPEGELQVTFEYEESRHQGDQELPDVFDNTNYEKQAQQMTEEPIVPSVEENQHQHIDTTTTEYQEQETQQEVLQQQEEQPETYRVEEYNTFEQTGDDATFAYQEEQQDIEQKSWGAVAFGETEAREAPNLLTIDPDADVSAYGAMSPTSPKNSVDVQFAIQALVQSGYVCIDKVEDTSSLINTPVQMVRSNGTTDAVQLLEVLTDTRRVRCKFDNGKVVVKKQRYCYCIPPDLLALAGAADGDQAQPSELPEINVVDNVRQRFGDWEVCFDDEGREFYYNVVTLKSEWEKPQELVFVEEHKRNEHENEINGHSTLASPQEISGSFQPEYLS